MNNKILQKVSYNFFNSVILFEDDNKEIDLKILDLFKNKNFIIDKFNEFKAKDLADAISVVSKNIVSNTELANTFYNDWNTVIEKEQSGERYIDQLLHYITVFGNEIIDEEIETYIPNRIKEVDNTISNLNIIKTISFEDFLEKFDELIKSNIALKTADVEDIASTIDVLSKHFNFNFNISEIKNKELKKILMLVYSYTPDKAIDLLTLIVNIGIETPLYIKNKETLTMLEMVSDTKIKQIEELFNNFTRSEKGMIELAKIFYRERKIILKIKKIVSDKNIKTKINKIRKLADIHKEVKKGNDYLLITTRDISIERKLEIIKDLDITYLTKIYNAISYRIVLSKKLKSNFIPYIYLIRNGSSFVKRGNISIDVRELELILMNIKDILTKKIQKNIDDNYITEFNSDNIKLAIPTSLKQFIGDIPFGSILETDDNYILATSWQDLPKEEGKNKGRRIDIDLSMNNAFDKIGWNSDWTDKDNTVIYSGDITSAPKGATEAFLCKIKEDEYMNLKVVDFTDVASTKRNVPIKFSISKAINDSISENPMIKSEDIIFQTGINLDSGNPISLGIATKGKFLFGSFRSIEQSNVSDIDSENLLLAFRTLLENKVKFNDLDLSFYTRDILEEKVKELEKRIEELEKTEAIINVDKDEDIEKNKETINNIKIVLKDNVDISKEKMIKLVK